MISTRSNDWRCYEAAHIFPIGYEQYWNEKYFGRWVSILPARGGSINSVQNGLLLRCDIHVLFDTYGFSINPDIGI